MSSSISSNIDQAVRAWKERANALRPFLQVATTEATRLLYAESRKQMKELIYDNPVPTRAAMQAQRQDRREAEGKRFKPQVWMSIRPGRSAQIWASGIKIDKRRGAKPAWKRTGNLKRHEKMHVASAYLGVVVNDASNKGKGYARPRHDLKRTRFPAPWRTIAIRRTRTARRKAYAEAMKRAMAAGVISRPTF